MGDIESRLFQAHDVQAYVNKSLVKASANGDEAMVQELLQNHMANVDGLFSGRTALHEASYNGHFEVIQVLLNYNVDVEKSKANGDRAMHMAAYGYRPDVVKLLHESGADLNACNRQMITPLHIGINRNYIRVVRTLIDLGCDLNLQDSEGNTPLHDAIRKEQFNSIYLLLKHGADATIASNDEVYPYPLHLAAQMGNACMVSLLVNKLNGERFVDAMTKDGYTALHLAALNDHVEVAELLIDVGKADMNLQNWKLESPLHLAVHGGHIQVFELLVRMGCDLNLQDEKGETPLNYAVRYCAMFKEKSQDIEMELTNWSGDSHLNLRSSLSFVRVLRANGAKINRKNNEGQTALDLPYGLDLLSEKF